MKMRFHSHVNETHFHVNGCAPGLALKERLKETRKLLSMSSQERSPSAREVMGSIPVGDFFSLSHPRVMLITSLYTK